MTKENVLYFTDGDKVVLTNSSLKVKDAEYPLDQIYSHKISTIPALRAQFAMLVCFGLTILMCATTNVISMPLSKTISILGFTMATNTLLMMLGIAVLLCALPTAFRLREKYVVRLSTAHGEKNVLVSSEREQVYRIIEAMNQVYLDLMKKSRSARARW